MLIPMSAAFSGTANSLLRFVDMRFETLVSCCDKIVLRSYSHFKPKIRYDFRPMSVRRPLSEFCDMLAYTLASGMYCEYFHEMKHMELFLFARILFEGGACRITLPDRGAFDGFQGVRLPEFRKGGFARRTGFSRT